ncbi:DNA gyrase inhibitor YacG [Legionella feeleii]|uniref:DNA gyrase inhibitor YacG n=1 Tax=Legionella feeleii TaxID=453 RepID=A0A0W0THZ1_9GAMM|nr:DNA gyrase inhibitor YacG [Legionella feeleii]KTC94821.1 DNA gyrase inhibitor YacG [Legionella feeleii]SPX60382.1 DNA gyrase inhibitor YacG [Legionella feeleii]STX37248.1 DNA gyrase inhibitor YacG [Legionella feeleii]
MNKLKKIACPTCGKKNTWYPENAFKPFCCERCKLIDLGEWARETRKIPGDSVDPTSPSADINGSRDTNEDF